MCDLLFKQAKQAENESNWFEAARLWRLSGRYDDANACLVIAKSNALGDKRRAYILEQAGAEPEVFGLKEDSIKWMAWFKKMDKASTVFDRIHATEMRNVWKCETY